MAHHFADGRLAGLAYIELYLLTPWRAGALASIVCIACAAHVAERAETGPYSTVGALNMARLVTAVAITLAAALVHGRLLAEPWARCALDTGIDGFANEFNARVIRRLYPSGEHLPQRVEGTPWVPSAHSGESDGPILIGGLIVAGGGLAVRYLLLGIAPFGGQGSSVLAAFLAAACAFVVGPVLAWYTVVYPRGVRKSGLRLPWQVRAQAWSPLHWAAQWLEAASWSLSRRPR